MAALTVMASGTFLPPVVIFEGQPKGSIAQTFLTFNDGAKYFCQKRAWMDGS